MLDRRVVVLLTSVGNEALHGFVADLRARAPRWVLVGTDVRDDAAGLYRCDARYTVPPRCSVRYLPELREVIQRHGADLLLPLSTADQDFFAESATQSEVGIPVVVSSRASVTVANHKVALFRALAGSGLLPPHAIVGDRREALAALRCLVDEHGAALLKVDTGTGSAGMLCVGTPGEDPAPAATRKWMPVKDLEDWRDDLPWPRIAVGYLPGSEYSVDILARDGEVMSGVVRQRHASTFGLSTVAETVDEPDVLEAATRVVGACGLSYVNNVQFRRDATGAPRLLEVNPRIPGTIGLTVEAGLNLPLAACCLALGHRLALPAPEIGLRIMRHYGHVFARRRARPVWGEQ